MKSGRAKRYGVNSIWSMCHIIRVSWVVEIGDEFEPEFVALHEDVRTEILALTRAPPAIRTAIGQAPR